MEGKDWMFNQAEEDAKRDAALDLICKHREQLVRRGREIAYHIWSTTGQVSAPQVLLELKRELPYEVASVDHRFMGAVFMSKSWKRVGYERTGSHGRPASIWAWKGGRTEPCVTI